MIPMVRNRAVVAVEDGPRVGTNSHGTPARNGIVAALPRRRAASQPASRSTGSDCRAASDGRNAVVRGSCQPRKSRPVVEILGCRAILVDASAAGRDFRVDVRFAVRPSVERPRASRPANAAAATIDARWPGSASWHGRASSVPGATIPTTPRSRSSNGATRARRARHSCLSPVWFVVRSEITRMPRACAARESDSSASSPPSNGSTRSNVVES